MCFYLKTYGLIPPPKKKLDLGIKFSSNFDSIKMSEKCIFLAFFLHISKKSSTFAAESNAISCVI